MGSPRALFDVNVLVSALLPPPHLEGTIKRIVRAGLDRSFTLLLPEAVLAELRGTLAMVPYLVARIPPPVADEFVASLAAVAELLPPLTDPPPSLSRDPHDDYLLAHATAGHADYLVSGDKDVLALASNELPFRIVSPAEFLAILAEAGLI